MIITLAPGHPGPIVSYNDSVVKIYNATSSLVSFKNKNSSSFNKRNNACVVVVKK
jgi:hypothetical protein